MSLTHLKREWLSVIPCGSEPSRNRGLHSKGYTPGGGKKFSEVSVVCGSSAGSGDALGGDCHTQANGRAKSGEVYFDDLSWHVWRGSGGEKA